MVDQTLAPDTPNLGIVQPGDEGGILDRDGRLIAIAIEGPGLDLTLGQLAGMQELMEGVQVVVTGGADLAQAGLQLGGAEQVSHRSISCPS